MDTKTLIQDKKIEEFCVRNHIKQLAFFGSVLRKDFSPKSDIDILVEFEEGCVPGFDFFRMEAELTQLFGRKVDLQTSQFLSPEIRFHVFSEAVIAYEQA
jgi:predicted nucleotidyltransferase